MALGRASKKKYGATRIIGRWFSIKSEFLITRQGRQHVLFAGLLDLAHSHGLKSIETELIDYQVDAEGEPRHAITKASVTMEDGRIFQGIGDATRKNVGKNIAAHLVRMSETRAKARALRDAVNIGVTALEELGEDTEPDVQLSPKAEVKPLREVPKETPEKAEVVDEGKHNFHKRLLGEVEDLLKKFPDGYFDDEGAKREFARRGVKEAEIAVDRLRTLLEYEEDGAPATEGPSEPSGYAHDEQVELLTKYADKLYSDRSKVLDGHEWLLQQRKVHTFHALTKAEAKDWIDEMKEELRAKEGVTA